MTVNNDAFTPPKFMRCNAVTIIYRMCVMVKSSVLQSRRAVTMRVSENVVFTKTVTSAPIQ